MRSIGLNAEIYISKKCVTILNVTRNDMCLIAGWSDKVFDIITAMDYSGNALDEIMKKVELKLINSIFFVCLLIKAIPIP